MNGRNRYIDAWGRGIKKILDACKENGLPEPDFEEHCGGMMVTLFNPTIGTNSIPGKNQVTTEVTTEVARLIKVVSGEKNKQELRNLLNLKNDEHFRKAYLVPAIEKGLIEKTIPDKPTSSKQKYRLTEKGRSFLLKEKT